MCAGFAWAALVNWQLARPWYRKPWMHVGGMLAGYYALHMATAYEQQTLKNLLQKYERRGYELPEVGVRCHVRHLPLSLHACAHLHTLVHSCAAQLCSGTGINSVVAGPQGAVCSFQGYMTPHL